jgi:hypothetical protein
VAKSITTSRASLCVLTFAALAGPLAMLCELRAADPPCIYLNPIESECPAPRPPGSSNCREVTAVQGLDGQFTFGGAVQYKPATDLWNCPERAQPASNATHTCHRKYVPDGTEAGEVVQDTCYYKTRCVARGIGITWQCYPDLDAVTPENDFPVWFSEVCGEQPIDPPGDPQ